MSTDYNRHYHAAQASAQPNTQKPYSPCPQLPGTVLRIFIPAGAVINVLNIIELNSPTGICLIVRIPLLGSNSPSGFFDSILDAVKQAGGTIEVVRQGQE